MPSEPLPFAPLPPGFRAVLLGAITGYAGILVALFLQGGWLLDAGGQPITADFVTFWAASRLAIAGQGAAIYDPALLKATEVAALGHDLSGSLGWYYPPHALLAVWPLSFLPLVPAQLAWTGATLALFALVLVRIAGRDALLLGLAFPAVLSTAMVGQNGFLIAALLGGALLCLERRPVLAGLFFAALSTKPQFGMLVPIALVFGGHWRAIGSAIAATLLLAAITALAFGPEVWTAFVASLAGSGEALLGRGVTGYDKLQSLFGLLRHAGVGLGPALAAQGALAAGTGLAVAAIWRAGFSREEKAAALATGVLLATPYVFLYDLPLLALPLAFLARTGLDRTDLALIGTAMLAVFAYPFIGASCGLGAIVAVAALVGRRISAAWLPRQTASVNVS